MTMTKETGTLKELNVKAGDVVQVVGGKSWEIVGVDDSGNYLINDPPARHLSNTLPFRIVSRAKEPLKPWRDMTPEEKAAIWLGFYQGKQVQFCTPGFAWFDDDDFDPDHPAHVDTAWRIKPEPVRETVAIWSDGDGNQAWLDLIDGKPDRDSLRWADE
jgi:hypothetical protein